MQERLSWGVEPSAQIISLESPESVDRLERAVQEKPFRNSRRWYLRPATRRAGRVRSYSLSGVSCRGDRDPSTLDGLVTSATGYSGVGAVLAVVVALRATFDERQRHETARADAMQQAAVSRAIEHLLPARTSYANQVWQCLADQRLDDLRKQLSAQQQSGAPLQLPVNFAEIFEPMKAAGRALTETARTLARLTAGLSEKSSTRTGRLRRRCAETHPTPRSCPCEGAARMRNELRGTT